MSSLIPLLSDAAVYLGLPLGLWISLRVLGYPDLSLEQLFVIGGALLATCVSKGAGFVSLMIALPTTAFALGFACSVLRNKCKVHPILISLAAAYLYYSLSLAILEGPSQYLGNALQKPRLGWAGVIACIVFGALILGASTLGSTRAGLKLIAAGSNSELAQRHGISSWVWQGVGLSIAFLLTMTSGCLYAWRATNIDVSYGSGLLLLSIFVVVLTKALQRRIKFGMNSLVLAIVLIAYLALLQLATSVGMPAQWMRGAYAVTLLALVLALPKSRGWLLAL